MGILGRRDLGRQIVTVAGQSEALLVQLDWVCSVLCLGMIKTRRVRKRKVISDNNSSTRTLVDLS
jgi:hypothetical protein